MGDSTVQLILDKKQLHTLRAIVAHRVGLCQREHVTALDLDLQDTAAYWSREGAEASEMLEVIREADLAAAFPSAFMHPDPEPVRCEASAPAEGFTDMPSGMRVRGGLFGQCLRFAGHSPDTPHDWEYIGPRANGQEDQS